MKYTDEEKKRNNEFKQKQEKLHSLYIPLDGMLVYGMEKHDGVWFVTNKEGERVYEASSLRDALYTQKSFTRTYVSRRDETMWGAM